jgi:hypothetical protein
MTRPVLVEVGPLPASSALAWLKYARGVLGELRTGVPVAVPADVLDAFEGYVGQWERAAHAGPRFRWQGEADPEVVEYLLHAWFNVANALARRAVERGMTMTPPEGQEFYDGLVRALLDALAGAGRGGTAFAEQLRSDWPGLHDDRG